MDPNSNLQFLLEAMKKLNSLDPQQQQELLALQNTSLHQPSHQEAPAYQTPKEIQPQMVPQHSAVDADSVAASQHAVSQNYNKVQAPFQGQPPMGYPPPQVGIQRHVQPQPDGLSMATNHPSYSMLGGQQSEHIKSYAQRPAFDQFPQFTPSSQQAAFDQIADQKIDQMSSQYSVSQQVHPKPAMQLHSQGAPMGSQVAGASMAGAPMANTPIGGGPPGGAPGAALGVQQIMSGFTQSMKVEGKRDISNIGSFEMFLSCELLSNQFFMLQHKITQCTDPSHYAHETHGSAQGPGCRGVPGGPPKNCSFFHSTLDRRRPVYSSQKPKNLDQSYNTETGGVKNEPSYLMYSHELCEYQKLHHQSFNPQFVCPAGDKCTRAHSEVEVLYHPAVYKTKPCKDMTHIQIRIFSSSGLSMKQFGQEQLESFSQCPYYHCERTDQRLSSLACKYVANGTLPPCEAGSQIPLSQGYDQHAPGQPYGYRPAQGMPPQQHPGSQWPGPPHHPDSYAFNPSQQMANPTMFTGNPSTIDSVHSEIAGSTSSFQQQTQTKKEKRQQKKKAKKLLKNFLKEWEPSHSIGAKTSRSQQSEASVDSIIQSQDQVTKQLKNICSGYSVANKSNCSSISRKPQDSVKTIPGKAQAGVAGVKAPPAESSGAPHTTSACNPTQNSDIKEVPFHFADKIIQKDITKVPVKVANDSPPNYSKEIKMSKNQRKKIFSKQYPYGKNTKCMPVFAGKQKNQEDSNSKQSDPPSKVASDAEAKIAAMISSTPSKSHIPVSLKATPANSQIILPSQKQMASKSYAYCKNQGPKANHSNMNSVFADLGISDPLPGASPAVEEGAQPGGLHHGGAEEQKAPTSNFQETQGEPEEVKTSNPSYPVGQEQHYPSLPAFAPADPSGLMPSANRPVSISAPGTSPMKIPPEQAHQTANQVPVLQPPASHQLQPHPDPTSSSSNQMSSPPAPPLLPQQQQQLNSPSQQLPQPSTPQQQPQAQSSGQQPSQQQSPASQPKKQGAGQSTKNKKEKIFIEIQSSYLHIQNPDLKLDQDKEDQGKKGGREGTPMTRDQAKREQYELQCTKRMGQSQNIKYLDLPKFKVEKCKNLSNGRQHNHKHCRYFHTDKDRRRPLNFASIEDLYVEHQLSGEERSFYNMLAEKQYQPDICSHNDHPEKCKEGCLLSHNRVESVYHPEKYKSKYCTRYPKNLSKCDYGDYCSFAHSTKELKSRLIHNMKKDTDFYIFYFKTEWCPFNKDHNHNRAQCVYAHNWQDFRRKPNIFEYSSHTQCSNWQSGTFISKYSEGCSDMASCPHWHGWKEQEYHPLFYKTKPCEDESFTGSNKSKCSRGIECPYYHDQKEKRVPKMMIQQHERVDFQYDKIMEESMNLSNINQLQELILIKFTEMLRPDSNQSLYLENKVTEEEKVELIKKGAFKSITLHFMLAKRVLLVDHFSFLDEKVKQARSKPSTPKVPIPPPKKQVVEPQALPQQPQQQQMPPQLTLQQLSLLYQQNPALLQAQAMGSMGTMGLPLGAAAAFNPEALNQINLLNQHLLTQQQFFPPLSTSDLKSVVSYPSQPSQPSQKISNDSQAAQQSNLTFNEVQNYNAPGLGPGLNMLGQEQQQHFLAAQLQQEELLKQLSQQQYAQQVALQMHQQQQNQQTLRQAIELHTKSDLGIISSIDENSEVDSHAQYGGPLRQQQRLLHHQPSFQSTALPNVKMHIRNSQVEDLQTNIPGILHVNSMTQLQQQLPIHHQLHKTKESDSAARIRQPGEPEDMSPQSKLLFKHFSSAAYKSQNFVSKKFNSERFDPNLIAQIDFEKSMNNMVEELTYEDKEKQSEISETQGNSPLPEIKSSIQGSHFGISQIHEVKEPDTGSPPRNKLLGKKKTAMSMAKLTSGVKRQNSIFSNEDVYGAVKEEEEALQDNPPMFGKQQTQPIPSFQQPATAQGWETKPKLVKNRSHRDQTGSDGPSLGRRQGSGVMFPTTIGELKQSKPTQFLSRDRLLRKQNSTFNSQLASQPQKSKPEPEPQAPEAVDGEEDDPFFYDTDIPSMPQKN